MVPAISVLFAYRDRLSQFRITLRSYQHFYGVTLDGIQLIVVDDTPSNPDVLPDLFRELGLIPKQHHIQIVEREGAHNPGTLYNLASVFATAPLVALTNPENLHCGPVLTHACEHWSEKSYLVYACRSLHTVPDPWTRLLDDSTSYATEWYQHTQQNNRRLHFMSVLNTDDFRAIQFDPAFDEGHSYEDNDFVKRIDRAGFTSHVYDDPYVAHQPHARSWGGPLMEKNRLLYQQKWGQ